MVVTTYLHNETLKRKDVANLTWITNGIIPWGGSLGVVTNYINTVGKRGMPSFPAALVNSLFKSFPVFSTVPTKNRHSRANQIQDLCLKDPRNLDKKYIYLYNVDYVTQKVNLCYRVTATSLSYDDVYSTKAYTGFSSDRKDLKQTWKNFYDQFL